MTSISNDSALTPRAQRDTRRMNWFVSIAAAVAGLLFGLDIGVISGALPFITDHFTLSSQLQEWVVSSMMPVSYTHLDVYKRQIQPLSWAAWW